MLHHLGASGKRSARKLRLWACAVCRLLPCPTDAGEARELAAAIRTAERFADGQADARELARASICSYGDGFWSVAGPDAFQAAELVAVDDQLRHRGAEMSRLLRDLFGNPFRPPPLPPSLLAWNDSLVKHLAEQAYVHRAEPAGHLEPARLAILADAKELRHNKLFKSRIAVSLTIVP